VLDERLTVLLGVSWHHWNCTV